jgi:N,N'-diacetylbacillosaminyl-diphospho-undecaprenol alpha-1,3-N-acetylgalactosaminyltransferase
VVTDNESAWIFRRHLLNEAVQRGFRAYLLAPSGPYDDKFRELGIVHLPIRVQRRLALFADLKFFWQVLRTCQIHHFDVVHNISLKPNLWGTIAASFARVPVIVGSVTGLGALFSEQSGVVIRLLRPWILTFYRLALHRLTRIWFQNADDLLVFEKLRLVKPSQPVLIRSSGVDVNYFRSDALAPSELTSFRRTLNLAPGRIVITMVSRTLWSKGT